LEAKNKPHPAQGKVDEGFQVTGNFLRNEIKSIFANEQTKKDKNGPGIKEVSKGRGNLETVK
jgi:hypothetical protein